MGGFKKIIIGQGESNLANVPNKLVAVQLFKNELVKEFALQQSVDGICDYCGEITKVLPLSIIVEYIDGIIGEYYVDPDEEGVGLDSTLDRDTISGFRSEGNGYVIPNNRAYYDEMSELLLKNGFVVKSDSLWTDIASALSYHTGLVERDPYGLNPAKIRWVDWQMIKNRAISMAREGKSLDDMISIEAARLDYLRKDVYQATYPFQVKKDLLLYRAVNYQDKLSHVLFTNITSPPVSKTREMRMSKKGDSVFYGSTNIKTTVKEASMDNSSKYTYIGEFKTKHPLRLLDLTGIPNQLSIFDQKQYHLLTFFRDFCNAISEYVPEQDAINYAPTQLITSYFRKKLKHYDDVTNSFPIDGILYSSSKDCTTNAVLFYNNENSANHLELLEWELIEH